MQGHPDEENTTSTGSTESGAGRGSAPVSDNATSAGGAAGDESPAADPASDASQAADSAPAVAKPEGGDAPASQGPAETPPAKSKRPRPPKVGPPTEFVRTIPDDIFSEISSGPGAQMLQKLLDEGFDVHVRETGIVAYWGGTVLAQIARKPPSKKEQAEFPKGVLSALVPRKLAEKVQLPKRSGLKGSQTCYRLDDEFFQAWEEQLDDLREVSERADSKDGPLEYKFMTTNPGSAGVLPLDRQVQVPNNRAKLDAVAVERDDEQRFLLVDLRNGISADIAKAHESLEPFFREMTDGSGGLKDTIAEEYKKMLAQRDRLGIASKVTIDQIRAKMPVVCLVGLSQFRAESTVKDRLIDASSKLKWPLYLCEFAGSDARVPRPERWEGLGKATGEAKPKPAFGL